MPGPAGACVATTCCQFAKAKQLKETSTVSDGADYFHLQIQILRDGLAHSGFTQ